jgi:tRNA A-37 threonylcarbamoyl transferase component Bud32
LSDESKELIGKVLKGRYEVIKELGRGGMAIVYLCTDRDLNRKVVVKAPKKALAAESEFRQRFEREIRSLLGLEHPHICAVLDAETKGDFPYVVLQYLSGGDLNDRLKAKPGPMEMKDILSWLPQVAKALDFIHAKGWVHRDVKPGNTLFDEYGNAFLGDFGIARAAATTDAELTQTGALIGSPQYMAPDLMLGHELSPQYDQYSLGCMVYAALSRKIPHQASTPIAIVHLRAIRPVPPLSEVVRGVPPGVEAAVMKSLSRDPKERFDTCEDLYEAIREGSTTRRPAQPEEDEPTLLIGEDAQVDAQAGTAIGLPAGAAASATGPHPAGKPAAPLTAPPKRRTGLLVAVVVVAAVLGGGGFLAWKMLAGRQPPALAELRVEPGLPVLGTGERIEATLTSAQASLAGSVRGPALKEVRAVARTHGDPFYAGLAAPTVSCAVTGESAFECAFEGAPGRYEVELTLSDGWSEVARTLDLKVAEDGLVPLPPNARGRTVFERVTDGARVVLVPGADGSPGLLVDEHEVSWRQYYRFLQAHGRREAPVPDWAVADSPVVNVDWSGAGEYCAWAAARLPTVDEWRRAAAGEEGLDYPWGRNWVRARANTADPDGHEFAAPVREFAEGASPFGLLNMVGNVAEWASDSPANGQAVVCGGSFLDRASKLGTGYRVNARRTAISIAYGLRCAMEPPGAGT